MDWVHLSETRAQRWGVLNTTYTAGNFLYNGGTVSFSRKFLLPGFVQIHVNVMLVICSSF